MCLVFCYLRKTGMVLYVILLLLNYMFMFFIKKLSCSFVRHFFFLAPILKGSQFEVHNNKHIITC